MKSYRESQEERLVELKAFLVAEKALQQPSKLYLNDLELSIDQLERSLVRLRKTAGVA